MRAGWTAETLALAGMLLAGLVIGLISGAVVWFLLLALTLYLLRHLYQAYRLEYWLRARRSRNPPSSWGLWGTIFDHYYRIQKRYYERKKRLARVIREFRESTAAMPDGTVVLDADWRILWFNQAASRLLGLDSSRDLGQPVLNILRNPSFEIYLVGGDFEQAVDIPSPLADNRFLSARLVPYGEQQYLLLVRDITRLQRLQAMRRDFVANASHELRSPLTVLTGYIETLAEDSAVPPDWSAPLVEMQAQCLRMNNLVNDLLELSRLETEDPEAPADAAVDIAGMVRRICDEAMPQARGRREIKFELEPDTRLAGIETELHSAFSNLIINAIRYTNDGGRIIVRWLAGADGGAAFEVEDNGIGIDPKHLPFITQRFYRVDTSRSRSGGGTGLGLAIVKHVLQRHGACLEITSKPGQCSLFRCVFPAERVRRAGVAETSKAARD